MTNNYIASKKVTNVIIPLVTFKFLFLETLNYNKYEGKLFKKAVNGDENMFKKNLTRENYLPKTNLVLKDTLILIGIKYTL
jgi:hypothetical protein